MHLLSTDQVLAYLEDCRLLTLEELERILPSDEGGSLLYQLMRDYPLRRAKALRPALCIAACRALGGNMEAVLPSAATLELYHNAFLIHDDVEDGSWHRRGAPTLHREHGVPIAVNTGDAMLALALQPLLANTRLLGLGASLRILSCVAEMSRQSVEGQALELAWIRDGTWVLEDADYLRMVHQKTTWYSFAAPLVIGAIVAGVPTEQHAALHEIARCLGAAFQIQDDVLNLVGDAAYGKEIEGDLWEGKHTLVLLHALRHASAEDRARARDVLQKRRPEDLQLPDLLDRLQVEGHLDRHGRAALDAHLATDRPARTSGDVRFLRGLIDDAGSVAHAHSIARSMASEARARLDAFDGWCDDAVDLGFLRGLTTFVVDRSV
jgi:geranylgeranyl diphosphate synthase type II